MSGFYLSISTGSIKQLHVLGDLSPSYLYAVKCILSYVFMLQTKWPLIGYLHLIYQVKKINTTRRSISWTCRLLLVYGSDIILMLNLEVHLPWGKMLSLDIKKLNDQSVNLTVQVYLWCAKTEFVYGQLFGNCIPFTRFHCIQYTSVDKHSWCIFNASKINSICFKNGYYYL